MESETSCETIQTGNWPPWTLQMHSTLSAELHSSSKCRTNSLILPWVWQCCGQHSHLLIRGADPISLSLWDVSDKVSPWDHSSSSALQPSSPGRSQHSGAVPHTYVDDIYLVGAPEKMPGVITSLQQNLGSVNLKLNTNKS